MYNAKILIQHSYSKLPCHSSPFWPFSCDLWSKWFMESALQHINVDFHQEVDCMMSHCMALKHTGSCQTLIRWNDVLFVQLLNSYLLCKVSYDCLLELSTLFCYNDEENVALSDGAVYGWGGLIWITWSLMWPWGSLSDPPRMTIKIL